MSRRRAERDPGPGLFDLPLDGPAEPDRPVDRPLDEIEEDQDREPFEELPLPLAAPPAGEERELAPAVHRSGPAPLEPVRAATPAPATVSLSARFLAGLADLAVHLALAVALLFGARLLGVPAGLGDGPALVLFLLIFSFLYTVIPLAFWSQTPGMAWAGIAARTPAGETLTFGQTARRWLGGLLSVALLGLPVLPAIGGGRSLADRLSDSHTVPA
jgi:uncharacterized RDD family membrane protein YckC